MASSTDELRPPNIFEEAAWARLHIPDGPPPEIPEEEGDDGGDGEYEIFVSPVWFLCTFLVGLALGFFSFGFFYFLLAQ